MYNVYRQKMQKRMVETVDKTSLFATVSLFHSLSWSK